KSGLVFDDALVETLHRELLGHDARLMGCLHFHQNGVPFPFQGVLSDQVETRANNPSLWEMAISHVPRRLHFLTMHTGGSQP
ncbi:hypothetical protein, partial [Desulfovibrio sp. ZJ200]|uniref:hypothetical protein n=1 Tax=Desulfovibrio sp. ZJ200 TaxID=2709792 RepID=UPI00197FFBA7